MQPRRAEVRRTTRETDIRVELDLDAPLGGDIETGHGMLDHLLDQLQRHGRFELTVSAKGDLHIDPHHLAEDCGITLGQAFATAVGAGVGIERYADAWVPMDETLVHAVVDLCGRPYLAFEPERLAGDAGGLTSYHLREFLRGFSNHARATLHVRWVATGDAHHGVEAVMKAVARALHHATRITTDVLPSTKGVL
jgi:imidazoleglycerol-phosphate dehydratase